MSTSNYSLVVSTTTDALKASNNAENKLKQAGQVVRDFYVTPEALRAVKKQFEADAIIPALDKKYQAYLALEIERGDKSEQAEVNRKNKATARGFIASYFSKIEAHAFPKEKTETPPREPSMAFIEDAIKLAKKGQKLENAPFNLLKVMAHMNAMLKEMNVTAETEM
jgi:hypothetical protein